MFFERKSTPFGERRGENTLTSKNEKDPDLEKIATSPQEQKRDMALTSRKSNRVKTSPASKKVSRRKSGRLYS